MNTLLPHHPKVLKSSLVLQSVIDQSAWATTEVLTHTHEIITSIEELKQSLSRLSCANANLEHQYCLRLELNDTELKDFFLQYLGEHPALDQQSLHLSTLLQSLPNAKDFEKKVFREVWLEHLLAHYPTDTLKRKENVHLDEMSLVDRLTKDPLQARRLLQRIHQGHITPDDLSFEHCAGFDEITRLSLHTPLLESLSGDNLRALSSLLDQVKHLSSNFTMIGDLSEKSIEGLGPLWYQIHALTMTREVLSDELHTKISRLFSNFQHLFYLNISYTKLDELSLDTFHALFSHIVRLRALNLAGISWKKLSDGQRDFLLQRTKQLNSLNLAHTQLNLLSHGELHEIFGGLSGLKSLTLGEYLPIEEGGLEAIFLPLIGLQALDLTPMHLPDGKMLRKIFSLCPNLQTLKIQFPSVIKEEDFLALIPHDLTSLELVSTSLSEPTKQRISSLFPFTIFQNNNLI